MDCWGIPCTKNVFVALNPNQHQVRVYAMHWDVEFLQSLQLEQASTPPPPTAFDFKNLYLLSIFDIF